MIIIIIIIITHCTHARLQVTAGTTNIHMKGPYATGTTIMCDVPAIADGTVPANRSDTVLHGKKKEKKNLPADRYSHSRRSKR